jgi:hypothetical protein
LYKAFCGFGATVGGCAESGALSDHANDADNRNVTERFMKFSFDTST